MKRLFAILICLTLIAAISLSGCSLKNNDEPASLTEAPLVTEEVSPTPSGEPDPTATEEIVPKTTEEVIPTATEEVVPAATEEISPTVTGEGSPSILPEITPTATHEIIATATAESKTTPRESAQNTIKVTATQTATHTSAPTNTSTVKPAKTSVPTPTPTAKPTPKPTATPTPTPTPVPTPSYFVAYEGYYDSTKRVSVVPGVQYRNLFNTRTYYTYPDTEACIEVPGTPSDWSVASDKYKVVSSLSVKNGKLFLKTVAASYTKNVVTGEIQDVKSGTGYVYLQNKKTGEKVKVYVIAPCGKTESRKQTNSAIEYYLYFEKGNYGSKFVEETLCITVYRLDETGYYTIPYLSFSSACGTTKELTPTGVFTIGSNNVGSYAVSDKRERWHDWGEGSNQYGQYAITYTDGRFLHAPTTGVGYCSEDAIMAGSHDEVGTHASSGCLRMQTGAIYWIWTHCPDGTKLEIRNLNPLGTRIERPEPMADWLGYDPTDPILVNYFK